MLQAAQRIACLFLLTICVATSVPGQVSPAQEPTFSLDSAKAIATVVQKKSRFLGWRFAAQSKQDTSRWMRRVGRDPTVVSTGGSTSTPASLKSTGLSGA